MLDAEKNFYDQNRELWLVQQPDKYVAIKGEKVIGFFDTEEEALTESTRRLGLTSFLLRKVGELEHQITIPALSLGILRANTTQTD
jgi:hypothetical protein